MLRVNIVHSTTYWRNVVWHLLHPANGASRRQRLYVLGGAAGLVQGCRAADDGRLTSQPAAAASPSIKLFLEWSNLTRTNRLIQATPRFHLYGLIS